MAKECCEQEDKLEALELRVEKLEETTEELSKVVIRIDKEQTVSAQNINHIFKMLGDMAVSVARIEASMGKIAEREDPFKVAMFDVGMWAVKVLIGGGAVVWLASKFGG